MTEENKKLVARYAELEAQSKAIEEEQKKIKDSIASEMEKLEADQIKSEVGTFYFTTRKTWKYPESIKKLEDEVKVAKKTAEETGEATFEEKKSLAFKAS